MKESKSHSVKITDQFGNFFWYTNNKLYRDNDTLPTVILKNGNKEWYKIDEKTNEPYCYYRLYYLDDKIYETYHNSDGYIHHDTLPAYNIKTLNGFTLSSEYWVNGYKHNIEGKPSNTWFFNGKLKLQTYHFNGKFHREGKPAVLEYNEYGDLIYEGFFINGHLNNPNGPSLKTWNDIGTLLIEKYINRGDGKPETDKVHNLKKQYSH